MYLFIAWICTCLKMLSEVYRQIHFGNLHAHLMATLFYLWLWFLHAIFSRMTVIDKDEQIKSRMPNCWNETMKWNQTHFSFEERKTDKDQAKKKHFTSPILWALPDPEWSGTQSSLPRPACADGCWTGWRCWPKLPVCVETGTAVCCDASPSGHCPGRSARQSPQLASAQEESRRPSKSLCSHRRI